MHNTLLAARTLLRKLNPATGHRGRFCLNYAIANRRNAAEAVVRELEYATAWHTLHIYLLQLKQELLELQITGSKDVLEKKTTISIDHKCT